MKNKISIILIISILLSVLSIDITFAEGDVNIIVNGGFETGSMSPWAKSVATAKDSITTELSHSGTYSAKLNTRTAAYESFRQSIAVKANRTYIFSMWVKLGSTDVEKDFFIWEDPGYTQLTPKTLCNGNTWTELKGEYKFTADKTIKIFANGTAETVYIDDVSVTPKFLASTVSVNGISGIVKPAPFSVATATYTTTILNQLGDASEMASIPVVWSIEGDNTTGISINSSGVLSVDDKATATSVKIIATATDFNKTVVGEKTVTLEDFVPDEVIVQQIMDGINAATITNQPLNAITDNLSLISEHQKATIAWTSTKPSIISTTGIVTRSFFNNETVTLGVTVSRGAISQTKQFELTVLQLVNLVFNEGFERGNITSWENTDVNAVNFAVSNSQFKTGLYSGLITKKTNDAQGVKQKISLMESGKTYYITGNVKTSNINSNVSLGVKKENADLVVVDNKQISKDEWVKLGETYTYEDTQSIIKPYLILNYSADTGAELYIDDFSVKDITIELTGAIDAVIKAEESRLQVDKDNAQTALNLLMDCDRKTALQSRINAIVIRTAIPAPAPSGGGKKVTQSVSFDKQAPISTPIPTPAPTPTPQNSFGDINGHWAKADIEYLLDKGIVTGIDNESFAPNKQISRAEFAALILRVTKDKQIEYNNSFSDVSKDDWYANIAETAYQNQLVIGANHLFRPNDFISREEMIKILIASYEKLAKREITDLKEMRFEDLNTISDWAMTYVQKAYTIDFVQGMNGNLIEPKQYATRAQAVIMIKRLYDANSN